MKRTLRRVIVESLIAGFLLGVALRCITATWVPGVGLFLTSGQATLSFHTEGPGRYAVTLWRDVLRQRQPAAIGWWDGRIMRHGEVW